MLRWLEKEAFRCRYISLDRQQKVNRLAVESTARQISIFVFNVYVGLVYAAGFVRPPQMRATGLVDLWRIRLDHRQPQLASTARPLLPASRPCARTPEHNENTNVRPTRSRHRVLTSVKRIGRRDWHIDLPYQPSAPNFAMEPSRPALLEGQAHVYNVMLGRCRGRTPLPVM